MLLFISVTIQLQNANAYEHFNERTVSSVKLSVTNYAIHDVEEQENDIGKRFG